LSDPEPGEPEPYFRHVPLDPLPEFHLGVYRHRSTGRLYVALRLSYAEGDLSPTVEYETAYEPKRVPFNRPLAEWVTRYDYVRAEPPEVAAMSLSWSEKSERRCHLLAVDVAKELGLPAPKFRETLDTRITEVIVARAMAVSTGSRKPGEYDYSDEDIVRRAAEFETGS
jgi:hypothetical protein